MCLIYLEGNVFTRKKNNRYTKKGGYMKLSMMTLATTIPGTEPIGLEQVFRLVKQAGMDMVDVSSIEIQFSGIDIPKELAENTLECQTYISFLKLPQMTEEGRALAVSEWRAAVDQAVVLGAKILMCAPSGYQEEVQGYSRRQIADALVDCLREIVAYAKEKEITVVIEDAPDVNLPMCKSDELLYILNRVPDLKMVYDSGNMIAWNEDPISYFDRVSDRVELIHIKDVKHCVDSTPFSEQCADGRKFMTTFFGEGEVDLKRLLKHTYESGYRGGYTLEYPPVPKGIAHQKVVQESKKYIYAIWKEI